MFQSNRAIASSEDIHVKRINKAMFFGGTSAFSLLYCVQPLMPQFAAEFRLSASEASWVLSIATLTLAFSLLASSVLSEFIDRRRLMLVAVASTALLTLLSALAQDYQQLLWLRALLGLALGGMPALAITYLSSEVPTARLSQTIGCYIAGTALGGMLGRLLGALLSDLYSWRVALLLLGISGLVAAWQFQRALPPGHASEPARPDLRSLRQMAQSVFQQIRQPQLLALFTIAFLLTGSYTGLYNYISFYLTAPPYQFSQSAVAAITLFYLFGIGSSLWGSMLTKRWRLTRLVPATLTLMLLGLLCTLHWHIGVILVGIALFTFGFFATHTLCSSWLATLVQAPKALVTALYLCCYYLGASVLGAYTGFGWDQGGWPVLVVVLSLLLLLATALSLWLAYHRLAVRSDLHRSVTALPATPRWQQHGALYPRDPNYIQLENGYVGMQPQQVMQAWQQHQLIVNSQGAWYLRQQFPQALQQIYQQLADFCAVQPDELLLTRNLSEGMHILLQGYPLAPGDEVICAGQDYDSVLASLQWLNTYKQVQIRVLQLPVSAADPQALLQCYADAITPRSRLMVLSHLCHRHGQILPVAQISQMARRAGVDVMVDAAHSFAQLDYRLPQLDADFIAINLHKWFGAPLGTGLLFIRKNRIAELKPLYGVSNNSPAQISKLAPPGTPAVPALLNIRDALAFQRSIGAAEKEQRLRHLTQYWLVQARQIPGVQIVTPADPLQSCAIAAFYLTNIGADDVVVALWQQARIFAVTRQLYRLQVVRITVQLFTQEAELDLLLSTLRHIVNTEQMAPQPAPEQQAPGHQDGLLAHPLH